MPPEKAKLRTLLAACLFCTGFVGVPFAKGSALGDIVANLGNVALNGQPNLSFDLAAQNPGAVELQRLGFDFNLRHRTVPAHGNKARSDWRLPALATAVYIDGQGDLLWLRPGGAMVTFRKADGAYTKGGDGSTASISPDGNEVKITTIRPAIWFYEGGFIKTVQAGNTGYYFKTDRETILVIKKDGASKPLVEITYSDRGLLSEIVFADGKKASFQWSPDNCLQRVTGDTADALAFEYDNKLLKNWRKGDGALHELKWAPAESIRRMAFGVPPVLLAEDSLYTYRWNREGGADTLTVNRKSGAFVSRTRFGPKEIIQQTPHGELHHAYKTTPIP
jgi:hypothetical protein